MKRLTNNDIFMITELRKKEIPWKWIARIYQKNWRTIYSIYRYRMKR